MERQGLAGGRLFVVNALCALCLVLLFNFVDCTHQRWWLYGCQCSNWESRDSVREVVMNSYRGLFVGRDDLSSLPVVKLHKNPGEASIQSYVANTLPHINSFINPGCCYTWVPTDQYSSVCLFVLYLLVKFSWPFQQCFNSVLFLLSIKVRVFAYISRIFNIK